MLVVAGVLALLAAAGANIIVYRQETPQIITIEHEFLDLPASFGPDVPYDGLRGLLVAGEPASGCGNMTAPPAADNFTDKWIVLVGRYNCSFEQKVRNAMAAGYDCVIVYNNSTELETMSAKNPEGIDIPSVFVNSEAGELLKNKYTYVYGKYYIMVNGDLPFNINTHLLLPFAVVVALCLIIIIIFMIVKCIKDRRRARRHRLPNRSLRKIPTCKFGKGDPYDTCAICLDDYQEGERLRVLPCAHAYHAKCIDPWLTQNRRVCPVCKRKVVAAGEREPRARASDSDDSDAPLLDPAPRPAHTQGGTFTEQRENPFSRAARLMARLRRGARQPEPDVEDPSNTDENNQPINENESEVVPDTAPLLPPSGGGGGGGGTGTGVGGGEGRRRSRRRRARSATAAPARDADAEGEVQPADDTHSINTETRGEIGVAALPAIPHSASTPLDRQPSIEYR